MHFVCNEITSMFSILETARFPARAGEGALELLQISLHDIDELLRGRGLR